MASAYILVIVCGLLALVYGVVTSRSVLAANAEDGQALIIGVVTGVERATADEDDRPRLSRPTGVRGVPRAS